MSSPNGNMTTDERRALKPGAVVSYRSERMLSEIQGTVDAVRCSGRLALCDGAFVFSCDYCRLVSAAPMVSTQPNVRGLDGDGVAPASGVPQDAPKAPGPVSEPSGKKPAPNGQGMVRKCQGCGKLFEGTANSRYCPKCRRERQSKGPGGKRADRELWALAVRDVDKARARGMTTAQAVAAVHKDAGFAALKLTVGNYRLWRRELAREARPVVIDAERIGTVVGPQAHRPEVPTAKDWAERLEEMRQAMAASQRYAAQLADDLNAVMVELATIQTAMTKGACAVCK